VGKDFVDGRAKSGQKWRKKEILGTRHGEFEGRAWRTPGEQIMARCARDLADAASGKSHRSMTEEQEEKGSGTIDGLWK